MDAAKRERLAQNALIAALIGAGALAIALWFGACGEERAPTVTYALSRFSYGATGTFLPDGTVAPADSVTLADTVKGAGHAALRLDLDRERVVGDPSLVGFRRWAFELHPTMLARARATIAKQFGVELFASPAAPSTHVIYWLFVDKLFGILPNCTNYQEPATCVPQDWQGAYRVYPPGAALNTCEDCVIEFAFFHGDGSDTFLPVTLFTWHAAVDSLWLRYRQRFGSQQQFEEWLDVVWRRQP